MRRKDRIAVLLIALTAILVVIMLSYAVSPPL